VILPDLGPNTSLKPAYIVLWVYYIQDIHEDSQTLGDGEALNGRSLGIFLIVEQNLYSQSTKPHGAVKCARINTCVSLSS
jgi:hypothetical protein